MYGDCVESIIRYAFGTDFLNLVSFDVVKIRKNFFGFLNERANERMTRKLSVFFLIRRCFELLFLFCFTPIPRAGF